MTCPADAAAPALVIAGMHRSGTSLATSLLAASGLHVGDALMGPGLGNPRGHFEDLEFVRLHERILAANGLSREGYTCQEQIAVPASARAEAAALVDRRRRAGRPWGWKDPRTTLFLDFWTRLLPEARFLFIVRPPWEVADSLFRRGDDVFAVNPRLAVDLWASYNRRVLAFTRAHPDRCRVVETGRVAADPAGLVAEVAGLLAVPLATPEALYDPDLLTVRETPERRTLVQAIRPDATSLFAELRGLAGGTVPLSDEAEADVAEAAITEWARGITAARATLGRELAALETRLTAERERDVAAARQEAADASTRLHAAEETFAASRRDLEHRLQEALAAAEAARLTAAQASAAHAAATRRRKTVGERIAAEGRRLRRRIAALVPRAA